MPRPWSSILSDAVQLACREQFDRYIDPPLPTGFSVTYDRSYAEYQVTFTYPRRVPEHHIRVSARALAPDPTRHTISQIEGFIRENLRGFLVDAFQDWDNLLVARAFERVARTQSHHSAFYNLTQWRNYLIERIRSHHQRYLSNNVPIRPYLSLRDVEREYELWVVDPGRPNPLHPRPQLNAPRDSDPVGVQTARERMMELVGLVLLGQEDINCFAERNLKLDAVEGEKAARELRERWGRSTHRVGDLRSLYEGYFDFGLGADTIVTRTTAAETALRLEDLEQIYRQLRDLENRQRRRTPLWRRDAPADYFGWDIGEPNYPGRTKEAETRGLALLEENLSPTQLTQWKKEEKFIVIGGTTGDKYEICKGYQRNVYRIDKHYKRKGLCFLPAGNLCIGDTLLAQKIGIELHEPEILRVAIPFNC